MKNFLGVFYGAIIVLSYIGIKSLAGENYICYFACSCTVLCVGILPFLRFPLPSPFSGILIRGVMYAATNFLILTAQRTGSVSASLCAALIGSTVVSVPSLLRPPYRVKNLFIVCSLILGTALLIDQINLSRLALISGAMQAITFSCASKVMRVHQISILWNLAIGYLCVAIFGSVAIFVFGADGFSNMKSLNLLCCCLIILFSQVAFFNLYKVFTTEEAGRYSLGRIPWGYAIDGLRTGIFPDMHTAIGISLLSLGVFLKKERRSMTRHAAEPFFNFGVNSRKKTSGPSGQAISPVPFADPNSESTAGSTLK